MINKKLVLLFIFIATILLRLYLTLFPGLQIDINTWQAWTNRLVEMGPSSFYAPSYFADYFPGYLYLLWIIGKVFSVFPQASIFSKDFEIILKLITNLFDILTAFIIFKIISRYQKPLAYLAAVSYLANPALIFNSSIWGQVDGVLTFFIILSLYLLLELKQKISWAIVTSLAILIKPQALAILPVIIFKLFRESKIQQFILLILLIILLPILIATPFFINDPALGLMKLFQSSAATYPYSSVFAFNLWSLVGFWKPDQIYQIWGIFLYLASLAIIIWPLFKKENLENNSRIYLALAISVLGFFLFLTRMHERYLFPFFAIFLIPVFIARSSFLAVIYIILSIVHLLNLWYVYFYYNVVYQNPQTHNLFFDNLNNIYPLLSFISILAFIILVINYYNKSIMLNLINLIKKIGKINHLLLVILVTTFLLRVSTIWYPNAYVFDEVYHAFTAKEYLKGSKEAWEWWTKPPPGVAYEWTHPPLAKELMAGSMFIFHSTDAWAWRLPGVLFGVLSVYLVYYLGKSFFQSEKAGIFASFVFCLDGLTFVLSRTGMNDIYLTTFTLISLVFFIRKRFFWCALFLGLAFASKWTALYLLAFYIILLLRFKLFKKIIYFILIPIWIYLASYLPFFLVGHTFDQFIELQKQIWWYHSGLKAHHDYASPWWSWPFNIYPVWFFVEYHGNNISNIFASGNPLMFLFSFLAVIAAMVEFIRKRSLQLMIVLLGYFIFWLPWAFSPRIMFLYHYSPSIPFMSLCLGYQLAKMSEQKDQQLLLKLLLILIILGFIIVYPFLIGIPLPWGFEKIFFSVNLAKNPF